MKKLILLIIIVNIFGSALAQQNYDDFEGSKHQNFGPMSGTLDSMHVNPNQDTINSSTLCARYIRNDTVSFDNIKMYTYSKLVDVSPYASSSISAPKITMKLYTTAPMGTFIELQLGKKADDVFPSGIHSVYQAVTSVQNAWEELEFTFNQIPPGSAVSATDIDKIILLFYPYSFSPDTFYFDDLTGPDLMPVASIEDINNSNFELLQNIPNPANDNTTIIYSLKNPGKVSLKLYNILGKEIVSIVDQRYQHKGNYRISLNTSVLPKGVYFYVMKVGAKEQAKRMFISR